MNIRSLLTLPCLLLLGGCAANLVAPPLPAEPRPVYLLDHGRHTSLLLTDAEAHLWRYAYGEWRWYVEFDRGPTRAAGALLRPSRAALGRGRVEGPVTVAVLQPQVGSLIEAVLEFEVEAEHVDALLASLDALFAVQVHSQQRSDALMLDVVEHPVPYTLGHNSNHVVAEWLRALDVEVRGSPLLGRWKVAAR
jgi:hypothetical protein